MKKFATILWCVILFFCLSTRNSQAVYYSWSNLTDFKGIEKYNLFLKGNLRYFRSDVEGRVAIGGNAKLKGFSLGVKADKDKYSLVVGGKLRAGGMANDAGGQVNNGGIYSGGEMLLKRVGLPEGDVVSGSRVKLKHMTIENGSVMAKGKIKLVNTDVKKDAISTGDIILKNSTVHGQIKKNTAVNEEIPVKFEDIDLGKISDTILSKASNSGTVIDNGQLLLQCTDPLVCYFNVSEKQIEDAWGIQVNASAKKTVVINVKNGLPQKRKLHITNMAFSLLGGIRSTNILYNFSGFKKLVMHHIGLMGSILAPKTTVKFYQGEMEGVLMAQNLYGGSWKKNIPGGQINSPIPVSEPSSMALLFLGLCAIAALCYAKIALP